MAPLQLPNTGIIYTQDILNRYAQSIDVPHYNDCRLAVGYENGYPIGRGAGDFEVWDYASGLMYSTANDLSALISLFFRDSTYIADELVTYTLVDVPADGGLQLIDGESLKEMMNPRYINSDKNSGFALPVLSLCYIIIYLWLV